MVRDQSVRQVVEWIALVLGKVLTSMVGILPNDGDWSERLTWSRRYAA